MESGELRIKNRSHILNNEPGTKSQEPRRGNMIKEQRTRNKDIL